MAYFFEHGCIFVRCDELIKIRRIGCFCTVVIVHYKSECSLEECRRRRRTAAALWPNYTERSDSSLATSTSATSEGRFNSLQTFSDGDVNCAAALVTRLPSTFSLVKTIGSIDLFMPYLVSKEFLLIF